MDDLGTHKILKRYWDTKEEVESLKQQITILQQKGYKSINILLVNKVLDDLMKKLGGE